MTQRLLRRLHRLHRALGSVLWLLLLTWFASGIVMTFAGYPSYGDPQRLLDAPVLRDEAPELPPALTALLSTGALSRGASLRLEEISGETRWLFDGDGVVRAFRTHSPWDVMPLSPQRAAQSLVASHPHATASLLNEPDQWSVALPKRLFPLVLVQLRDAHETERYFCAATGELVQQTNREQRLLAWLGAIPHWIYPTLLRKERTLWRLLVLSLAGLSLLLTAAGWVIGVSVARRASPKPIREPLLRLHQRIGIGFGVLACAWLFSGFLSLTPFQWTQREQTSAQIMPKLLAPSHAPLRAAESLALCRGELSVRTLRVRLLGGQLYVICEAAAQSTRLVRQHDGALTLKQQLDGQAVTALLNQLSPDGSGYAELLSAPDSYYYPTHYEPIIAPSYARLTLGDAAETSLYVDTHRATLLALHTRRTRLERWLYHGLHSWDLPGLYQQPWLWQGGIGAALALGALLSALGGLMATRRMVRRRRKRRLEAARQERATARSAACS